MKKHTLNDDQRSRLVAILQEQREKVQSFGDLSEQTGLSTPLLRRVSNGSYKHVNEFIALEICKSFGISPFYILEGKGRKYKDWRAAFDCPSTDYTVAANQSAGERTT